MMLTFQMCYPNTPGALWLAEHVMKKRMKHEQVKGPPKREAEIKR